MEEYGSEWSVVDESPLSAPAQPSEWDVIDESPLGMTQPQADVSSAAANQGDAYTPEPALPKVGLGVMGDYKPPVRDEWAIVDESPLTPSQPDLAPEQVGLPSSAGFLNKELPNQPPTDLETFQSNFHGEPQSPQPFWQQAPDKILGQPDVYAQAGDVGHFLAYDQARQNAPADPLGYVPPAPVAPAPVDDSTQLVQGEQPTAWDSLKEALGASTRVSPERQAMAVSLAEEYGVSPSSVLKNWDVYRKQAGMHAEPSGSTMMGVAMMAPMVPVLAANPVGLAMGLGGFEAASEAVSGLVSYLNGKPYQIGDRQTLVDLLAPETGDATKFAVEALDFGIKGAVAGGGFKYGKKGWDIASKRTTVEGTPSAQEYMSPEDLVKIRDSGVNLSDFLGKLDLRPEEFGDALRNGVDVFVPAGKKVTTTDRPWVESLKNVLGIDPTFKQETSWDTRQAGAIPADAPRAQAEATYPQWEPDLTKAALPGPVVPRPNAGPVPPTAPSGPADMPPAPEGPSPVAQHLAQGGGVDLLSGKPTGYGLGTAQQTPISEPVSPAQPQASQEPAPSTFSPVAAQPMPQAENVAVPAANEAASGVAPLSEPARLEPSQLAPVNMLAQPVAPTIAQPEAPVIEGQAPLRTVEELTALPVRELRAIAQEAGIRLTGIVKKSDVARMIVEAQAPQISPQVQAAQPLVQTPQTAQELDLLPTPRLRQMARAMGVLPGNRLPSRPEMIQSILGVQPGIDNSTGMVEPASYGQTQGRQIPEVEPADVAAVRRGVGRGIRNAFAPGSFQRLEERSLHASAQLAGKIGRALGVNPQFLSFPHKANFINGLIIPGLKNQVYVNVDASKPHMFVLLHEVGETIKVHHPDIWAGMRQIADEEGISEALDEYHAKLVESAREQKIEEPTREEAADELLNDFIGERGTEASFWRKLAAMFPDSFLNFARQVQRILNTALREIGFKKTAQGAFRDVKRMKKAVDQAVAEFYARTNKMSRADAKAAIAKDLKGRADARLGRMAAKVKADNVSVSIPSHEESIWSQPLDIESKLDESDKKALELYRQERIKQAKLDPPRDPIYALVKGRLDPSSVSPEERKALNTKFGPSFWGRKGQRLHLDELEMEMKNNPLFGASVKENYGSDNLLTQLLYAVKSDKVMMEERLDDIDLEHARLTEEVAREREQERQSKSQVGETGTPRQGQEGNAEADRRNGGPRGEVDLNDFTDVPFSRKSAVRADAAIPQVAAGKDWESLSPDAKLNDLQAQYSVKSWTPEAKQKVIALNAAEGLVPEAKLLKWMGDVDSVAKTILGDLPHLDYEPDRAETALKKNGDPQYRFSVDFSTICRKRALYQATIDTIAGAVWGRENRTLTKDELLDVRQMMQADGQEVSCGPCYVDTARLKAWSGIQPLAEKYPELAPKMFSAQGWSELRRTNPDVFKELRRRWTSLGGKSLEPRTDYRGEILKVFGGKAKKVELFNRKGGLRFQSWSDMETPHVIDDMQTITDAAVVGLKGQAYTKELDFVDLNGRTGMMINMSLIAPLESNGLGSNNELIFSKSEGIDPDEAFKRREMFDSSVGTVLIGVSDAHIRTALKDPRIDFVIPYHHSGLGKPYRARLNMNNWQDYTHSQHELMHDPEKNLWFLKELRKAKHPEPKYFAATVPFEDHKGDVEKYVKLLGERGLSPKFPQFLNDEGYVKLLGDRRLFDAKGRYIDPKPMRAEFDMPTVQRILHTGREVGTQPYQPVVDKFLAGDRPSYSRKSSAGGEPIALGEAPVFYSQMQRVLEKPGMLPKTATANSMLAAIEKHVGKFKGVEFEESGLKSWLQTAGARLVTRQDVLDEIASRQIEIKEVEKGDTPVLDPKELAPGYRIQKLGGNGMYLARTPGGMEQTFRSQDEAYEYLNKAFQNASSPDTKYGQYQVPGGENYRELLLTLPVKGNESSNRMAEIENEIKAAQTENEKMALRQEYKSLSAEAKDAHPYQSAHWEEPNVLAHVRTNERTDADGKRVLFIEEIQSDMHQEGKKKGYGAHDPGKSFSVQEDQAGNFHVVNEHGDRIITAGTRGWAQQEADRYNSEGLPAHLRDSRNIGGGVPDAPFKNTSSWAMLAMKRMIRHAAENGFDRISWTPGDVQAERYDLSKQLNKIDYEAVVDEDTGEITGYDFSAQDKNGNEVIAEEDIPLSRIEELAGKEIAQKIEAGEGTKTHADGYREWKTLSGLDLKVGGEGMKGFYDTILPKEVAKYIKQFGGKVETSKVRKHNIGQDKFQQVWSFDLTPQMKQAAMEGQPLYQRKPKSDSEPIAMGSIPSQGSTGRKSAQTGPPAPTKASSLAVKLELPELVTLAKGLLGKYPKIFERLYGRRVGSFHPGLNATSEIKLKASNYIGMEIGSGLFKTQAEVDAYVNQVLTDNGLDLADATVTTKAAPGKKLQVNVYETDPEYAAEVLAHEIGHLIDFLPDQTNKRGNILGHIASLKKHMGQFLASKPGGEPPLTPKDRMRMQAEAKKLLAKGAKQYEIEVDEEIEKLTGLTPDDVLAIWRDSTAKDRLPTDFYNYVAGLSGAEKKSIMISAMKGLMPPELRQFVNVQRVKTGRKIKQLVTIPGTAPTKDEILAKWQELIQAEIAKRKLWNVNDITEELKSLTKWWNPFDPKGNPKYTAYRHRPTELYADALSVLLNAPQELLDRAPKFYEAFFNYAERKPEVMRNWDALQSAVRSGDIQKDRVIRLHDGFAAGDEAYKSKYKKKLEIVRPLKAALLDRFFPVYDALTSPVPRYAIEKAIYSGSQREGYIKEMFETVQKPLEKAGLTAVNMGELLFHKRIVYERDKIANPQGWTAKTSGERLKEMLTPGPFTQEQIDVLKAAEEKFREIRKAEITDLMRSSRMFTPELMQTMEAAPAYATFDVFVHSVEEAFGRGVGAKIHQQIGTHQDITNPYAATIMKDLAMIGSINWNTAKRAVIEDMLRGNPGLIEPADRRYNGKSMAPADPKDPTKGMIAYMDRGEVKAFYVDKMVADAFDSMTAEEMSAIGKLLFHLAQPFRLVFTQLRPGFQMFNIIRDLRTLVINMPGANNEAKILREYFKAVGPAFQSAFGLPQGTVREMERKGIMLAVADPAGLENTETQIDRMFQMYGLRPKVWEAKVFGPMNDVATWLAHCALASRNFAFNLGGALERIPKVAGYTYLKKYFPGMSEDEIAHRIRSHAGSPAFLNKSAAHAVTNNLFLFSNAFVQGNRASLEAMRDDPKTYWWKWAKWGAIPTILKFAAGAGLLGMGIKKIMDGVSEYDKTNYSIIPLGSTKEGKSVYMRLPQDEFTRATSGVLWKVLSSAHKMAKGGSMDLGGMASVFDFTSGQFPGLNPALTILGNTVAVLGGHNPYDPFRQRPIMDDKTFKAGGKARAEAFGKWAWNAAGGGIVYTFPYDDIERNKGELAKIIGLPGIGDTLGRFLKVSSTGLSEQYREAIEPVQKRKAQESLAVSDAAATIVNGKTPTNDEIKAMGTGITKLKDQVKMGKIKAADSSFLSAWERANGPEEKAAIYRKWQELEGK